MELAEIILTVLELLRQNEVPVCVVGEFALNYYNVPRVINVSFPFLKSSLALTEHALECRVLRSRKRFGQMFRHHG